MLPSLAECEFQSCSANLATRSSPCLIQLLIGSKANEDKEEKPETTSYRQAREVFEARLKHFRKTTVRSDAKDPFLRPSWETAKREIQDEGFADDDAQKLDILTQAQGCFHSPNACGRFSVSPPALRAMFRKSRAYNGLSVSTS